MRSAGESWKQKKPAEQVIARAHADRQHVNVLQARQQQESEARLHVRH
jgi:hypothetical protein